MLFQVDQLISISETKIMNEITSVPTVNNGFRLAFNDPPDAAMALPQKRMQSGQTIFAPVKDTLQSKFWMLTGWHGRGLPECHQALVELADCLQCKWKALLVCVELCPSTKVLHYHAYVELLAKTRFSTVKEALHSTEGHAWSKAHVEPRVGTAQQAIDYVKKDGQFEQAGEFTVNRYFAFPELEECCMCCWRHYCNCGRYLICLEDLLNF